MDFDCIRAASFAVDLDCTCFNQATSFVADFNCTYFGLATSFADADSTFPVCYIEILQHICLSSCLF